MSRIKTEGPTSQGLKGILKAVATVVSTVLGAPLAAAAFVLSACVSALALGAEIFAVSRGYKESGAFFKKWREFLWDKTKAASWGTLSFGPTNIYKYLKNSGFSRSSSETSLTFSENNTSNQTDVEAQEEEGKNEDGANLGGLNDVDTNPYNNFRDPPTPNTPSNIPHDPNAYIPFNQETDKVYSRGDDV